LTTTKLRGPQQAWLQAVSVKAVDGDAMARRRFNRLYRAPVFGKSILFFTFLFIDGVRSFDVDAVVAKRL